MWYVTCTCVRRAFSPSWGSLIKYTNPRRMFVTTPPGHPKHRCCARNHDFGDGPGSAACDQLSVAPVMSSMIDAKVDYLWSQGKVFDSRVFMALKPWLMRGLPAPPGDEETGGDAEEGSEGKDDRERCHDGGGKSNTSDGGRRGLAAARKLFRWRDDATEATETIRCGVGLLFW